MRLIESINLGDIPQHEISTSSASSVKSNHYSVFSYNKLKFKNEFQIDKWIIFIEGAKSNQNKSVKWDLMIKMWTKSFQI